ncbi:MAG TPA: XTP/dITP diphosphatase [Armatimonadota bacterium]|nr:XTP/dITP diphosphatase [Armatimonadota bacterium]
MDIVVATRNKKKLEELKSLLSDMPIDVLSLLDFPNLPETPETGNTFAENAELKAKAAAQATGRIALADDSGLEVDALGGQPGILSSRFAGPEATDREKYMRILDLLEGVPDEERTARFKAAVAIATLEGETVLVEGTCEGRIAREPRGENGFGYDPIFYLPDLGLTMAQLPASEKNRISHRARALQSAKKVLRELLD